MRRNRRNRERAKVHLHRHAHCLRVYSVAQSKGPHMQLIRFRVDLAPRCSLGPGKIALLEAIGREGSLTRAAASLSYSYRYAWLLLEDLNESFDEPVTQATVGGRRGGGVELTKFGGELIR